MRSHVLAAVVLLALSAGCADDQAAPLEPETPRDSTGILERAIVLAERDHPGLDRARVHAAVDELVGQYRDLAAEEPADAFARLLFGPGGFEIDQDLSSLEALHVDTVLSRRRGYCLSLSIVALAVAEEVGAPLFGVAAPNHFFVRYDSGQVRRNIELTRGGAEVTDQQLRDRIGPAYREDSIYLRNLNMDQVEAVLLHNRGFVAMLDGRREEARADFLAAIALLPELPEPHRNLGVLLGEGRHYTEAIRRFDSALALFPGDGEAMFNRAICKHALGEIREALEDLTVAQLIHPRTDELAQLAVRWRAELEDRATRRVPGARALDDPPAGLEPGLVARYYSDVSHRTLALERIDRDLDFDWQNRAPGRGVPRDRFSARWEGWLKVPHSATYSLFVVANDGVRVSLDDEVAIENWRRMGHENYTDFVDMQLTAGWHTLRVEHYDERGGARLMVRFGRDGGDVEELPELLFHQPKELRDEQE